MQIAAVLPISQCGDTVSHRRLGKNINCLRQFGLDARFHGQKRLTIALSRLVDHLAVTDLCSAHRARLKVSNGIGIVDQQLHFSTAKSHPIGVVVNISATRLDH